jgi:hypothetical protein
MLPSNALADINIYCLGDHIESGLLMADDDDNRSYINRSWNHLVTHVTLRSVNIVVPDEMIPAKQN